MTNWTELTENNLPEPNTLVWVKRNKGNIYLASRRDMPLATNPDASKDCHWYGNPLETALCVGPTHQCLEPAHNFSDVTVKAWMPVSEPAADHK